MSTRFVVTAIWSVAFSLLLLTGCTWVKLTPEAAAVNASTADAVEACEQLGRTKARTSAKAWIFPRREGKVREELLSLARDDAAEMGGTDVAPLGEMADGRQEFGIYRCGGGADAAITSEEAGGDEAAAGDEPAQ